MKTYNELQLAKELMRFPSITPVDAGTMNFLAKNHYIVSQLPPFFEWNMFVLHQSKIQESDLILIAVRQD